MSPQEAFGPNLRRIRIQRGITLEQIAAETKVSVNLWDGLEHNDFGRWPAGIFARSYVREYASLIGVDPESTVDEFCRWFSRGDRRVPRLVREQAEIVGHQLEWLRNRLLELAQERNRFLRHMSHELKTPLANIREGWSQSTEKFFSRLGQRHTPRGSREQPDADFLFKGAHAVAHR